MQRVRMEALVVRQAIGQTRLETLLQVEVVEVQEETVVFSILFMEERSCQEILTSAQGVVVKVDPPAEMLARRLTGALVPMDKTGCFWPHIDPQVA